MTLGIGKTTLVQSICQSLRKEGIKMSGFYTQELRQHHEHRRGGGGGGGRVGFDVVTLDGHRSPLARLKDNGYDLRIINNNNFNYVRNFFLIF